MHDKLPEETLALPITITVKQALNTIAALTVAGQMAEAVGNHRTSQNIAELAIAFGAEVERLIPAFGECQSLLKELAE